MIGRLAPIGALLLGTLVFMLGNGLLGTLLAVRISAAGDGAGLAGLVAAAYFIGLIAGCLVAPSIVSKVGHIRAFAVFAAGAAASSVAFPLWDVPAVWIVLRLIGGLSMAGLFTVTESWLNAASDTDSRGRVLASYMTVVYLSLGLGQLLLGLYSPSGFELFSIAAMLFALSLVPVSMTQQQAPDPPLPAIMGFIQLYRVSPLGCVGAVASGLILGAFYGLAPVFAQQVGMSVSDISLFMAAAIIGGLVVQGPVGLLSDRLDRRKVLTASLTIVAVGAFACLGAALVSSIWGAAVAAALMCVGFAVYPLAVGHANDHVQASDAVALASGLLMSYSAGAAIGPLVGAVAMQGMGPYGLIGFVGLIAALASAFAFYRMTVSEPVPLEDQGPSPIAPRTSTISPVFDVTGETDWEREPDRDP